MPAPDKVYPKGARLSLRGAQRRWHHHRFFWNMTIAIAQSLTPLDDRSLFRWIGVPFCRYKPICANILIGILSIGAISWATTWSRICVQRHMMRGSIRGRGTRLRQIRTPYPMTLCPCVPYILAGTDAPTILSCGGEPPDMLRFMADLWATRRDDVIDAHFRFSI